jgi:NitT/TauT family transport system substrate-binding protein
MEISIKIKALIVIFIIVGVSLGIFGIVVLFSNTENIRVGALTGDLHHLPLFVALEKDFHEQEGLDLDFDDILWFPNGNEVMGGFEAGSLDVSYLGLAPAMAHKLNVLASIKIVGGVNVNGSSIVVGNSSGITNITNLVGKNIGVPSLNNMQDFVLQIALANENLSIEDVSRTVLNVGNMENMLDLNEIDGFIAWEPFNAKAVDNIGANILVNSGEIWPNHPCCIIASSISYLETKSSDVEKIVGAHKRALEWIANESNHDEVISIAKKYTGITLDSTIELALSNIGYIYNFTEFMPQIETFYDNLTNLNSNIDAWPAGKTAFIQEFFDDSFLGA